MILRLGPVVASSLALCFMPDKYTVSGCVFYLCHNSIRNEILAIPPLPFGGPYELRRSVISCQASVRLRWTDFVPGPFMSPNNVCSLSRTSTISAVSSVSSHGLLLFFGVTATASILLHRTVMKADVVFVYNYTISRTFSTTKSSNTAYVNSKNILEYVLRNKLKLRVVLS